MANLLQDNAYNVLGLDTSASEKVINKRAKEIINLLRIDEEPVYDTDLKIAHVIRKESVVKDALLKLSSPTKRIREYFFWFDIESDTDEKAINLLKEEELTEAIELWKEQGKSETANGFIAKKNLAVLASLLLFGTGQKKYLTESIGAWKDILQSDKFWPHFQKLYALNDEIGTSQSTIEDFAKSVDNELSDFYTDVSEKYEDRNYYSLFTQVFAVKGQKIQREVLSPIYEAINDASVQLTNLNISEHKIISDDEIDTLRRLTRTLQDNFNKLKELGLYSDSQAKTMRDRAAEALRTVGLDLYNNLNESAKPAALFSIAAKIAGTVGLQEKLQKDIEQLRKNIAIDKIIKPINELLTAEDFKGALRHIEEAQKSNKGNSEVQTILSQRLKWCITGIADGGLKHGKKLYDKNKFGQSQTTLSQNVEFILSYLEQTDINREYVDGVLSEIDRLTSSLGKDQNSGKAVDNLRNGVVEQAEKNFKDQFEGSLLVILIDSALYANLAEKLPALKRQKQMKSWASTAAVIVILIIIGIANGGNNSSSTNNSNTGSNASSGSTAYNDCVNQYNNLKSQLDSINTQEANYKNSGDTLDYNALIPQQNSLVDQVNAKATECKGL